TFLAGAGFDQARVCRALKIDDPRGLLLPESDGIWLGGLAPGLAWCIRVLVRGETTRRDEAREACGDDIFASLCALGLLAALPNTPETLWCPVWLYPVGGFVIVSDRHRDVTGRSVKQAADAVFPGCFEGTLTLLHRLPDADGGDALDLCGGTGIAALHLANTVARAATTDVTPRAAHFAAFNAALNGVAVESLCGHLYAPLGDRMFDVIVCHPPYLPGNVTGSVARDGGEVGDGILRGVIAGLPRHLRAGGVCVVLALGAEYRDAGLETRAAQWLGEARNAFSVVLDILHRRTIEEVLAGLSVTTTPSADDAIAARAAHLRASGVVSFAYGVIRVTRRGVPARRSGGGW
ncbi:MAG: methyltransferase, partial [Rhizobiales bacterium]|nr:methyltransferase [Hyphomicrobiales bacterium]